MTPATGRANKWVIAVTVLTGTFMAVLDSSIVNVALPDMRGTLGATVDEITWVVTAFILANVIIMPVVALLSARFGRKNFYLVSVAAFTGASMLCGTAKSLDVMIVYRIIQGLAGGTLITASQAILLETFPREQQGLAMGLYGMGVVLAPAFGPTLGGWLTDHYSWPWIFYINVPVGAISLLMFNRYIEDPPYLVRDKGRIDWLGLALMTVGLGALQLMLEKGGEKNWFESSFIVTLAAVAGAGLLLFTWRELVAERPAVNLRLLKNIPFTSATLIGGVLGMGLYGTLFVLPLFLQGPLGYTAFKSGLALIPRSLAMTVVMPLGGWFYNRLGPRFLVGLGLAVSAYSFWELSHLTTTIGFWDIFVPQLWQGVGFSLIFVALSTAALSSISKPDMTAASGLYNVVRRVFGSVGVAAAATELTTGTSRYHDVLAQNITIFDFHTREFLRRAGAAMARSGSDAITSAKQALALLNAKVNLQATTLAYNHVFQLVMILFAASVPLVFFLSRRGNADGAEIAADVEIVAD
ncbi:MAG TPA: DHA2 family efflux MFS transporter permease subunit [Gemmatimonadales bacterium]|nr:DHA2 family efflux MFS transporter permease subunit [Gemmatimonadales bacterium]